MRTARPVQYRDGQDAGFENSLVAARRRSNWDVAGHGRTQVRLGTGLFTGPPLYVWISNQLGNTGVLIGEVLVDNTTAFPFSPNPDKYKPANVTGEGATSFELNVTDPDFKFPQVWRTNLAVDHRLPGGVTGTVEFLYNKDVNGIYYINANLPAAQTTFADADARPRWTANRINNTTPNVITSAFVLKNQNIGTSWNLSGSLSKTLWHGLSLRGAYSYGRGEEHDRSGLHGLVDVRQQPDRHDPNNPGLGISGYSQGHRVFVQASYYEAVLQLRLDDDLDVLGSEAVVPELRQQRQLRVQRRHERRRVLGQRPHLHPARHGRDELRARSRTRTAACSQRPSRPRRSRRTSSRIRISSKHRGEYAERGGDVPADVQQDGLELDAGRVPQHRRQAELRPVPPRHHELREPAELGLGRRIQRMVVPDDGGQRRSDADERRS